MSTKKTIMIWVHPPTKKESRWVVEVNKEVLMFDTAQECFDKLIEIGKTNKLLLGPFHSQYYSAVN